MKTTGISNSGIKISICAMEKDYKTAYEHACSIVGILNAPALNGYKCFWNYMAGCMAYYLFKMGKWSTKLQVYNICRML